jgi:DNA-binding NarL/FixJ family response regulator
MTPLMTPLRTYLVEDSPVIRENLIATLEELAPVRVVGVADDEQEALAWLAAQQADLVIVDLFLAQGSGLGVLRARQPSSRYVVLSNYVNPAMRARCLALGADGVFDKSTEIDALIAYCGTLAAPPA